LLSRRLKASAKGLLDGAGAGCVIAPLLFLGYSVFELTRLPDGVEGPGANLGAILFVAIILGGVAVGVVGAVAGALRTPQERPDES